MSSSNNSPIACVLDAIPNEHRERHEWLAHQFIAAINNVSELENGYQFGLPDQPNMIVHVAEWIAWERLCCPFFHFHIEVEQETISVSLTGGEGVKDFLKSELLGMIEGH